MGLIRYGGGIVQISGSIAGTTFARNKSGNYARARTKPINKNSPAQQLARNAMSAVVSRWLNVLTESQRGGWIAYAGNVAAKNRLGEVINLSGFNHFVRSNSPRALLGLAQINNAPTEFTLPEKDAKLTIRAIPSSQEIEISFDDTQDWCSEDDSFMVIYEGSPIMKSHQFFGGPYRLLGSIAGSVSEPAQSPVLLPSVFPISSKSKVYARARIERADARLSGLFGTNTEAAAAYCLAGTLVPDLTGTYKPYSYYNDAIVYKVDGGGKYCWYSPGEGWIVSTAVGEKGEARFQFGGSQIQGNYTPNGDATGTGAMTAGECS